MNYKLEDLEKAVEAVQAGVSIRQASKQYGDRISGRFDV
jgi:hypothetical protein